MRAEMLASVRSGRVKTLPLRAISQLKYRQQWFIHLGDVLRDDRIVGGLRTIDGMEGMLQRYGTVRVRSFENRAAPKNKDLLSSDKMLFVGVKW
jgi:hypothetical protein